MVEAESSPLFRRLLGASQHRPFPPLQRSRSWATTISCEWCPSCVIEGPDLAVLVSFNSCNVSMDHVTIPPLYRWGKRGSGKLFIWPQTLQFRNMGTKFVMLASKITPKIRVVLSKPSRGRRRQGQARGGNSRAVASIDSSFCSHSQGAHSRCPGPLGKEGKITQWLLELRLLSQIDLDKSATF